MNADICDRMHVEKEVEALPRRQGELLFVPAEPAEDAVPLEPPIRLGGHHIFEGGRAVQAPETVWLRGGQVRHERGEHKPLPLSDDLWYQVVPQRQFVRQRTSRVAD